MEQSQGKTLQFSFNGSGGEYFKIWITNVFLTILTLGIYSAWAKVRRNRYFYGNTHLANTSFDYLAKPKNILKGRLLAFGVFVIYGVLVNFMPILELPFAIAFLLLLPWLVVMSMRFRTRNTAYRNIRFGFDGRYGEAIRVFVLLPVLALISLGLAYPYMLNRQKKFIVANSRFGTTAFTYSAKTKAYFKILGVLFLAVILAVAGFAGTAYLMRGQPPSPVMSIAMPIASFAFYFWIFAFTSARIGNLVYNSSQINGNSFKSSLRIRDLFWLYITNTLAAVVTLGLMIPWAQVRLARYRARKLQLLAGGDIDSIVAGQQEKIGSAGEEIGEMFDIDIGL